ncbi:kelch repeat protein [Ostertagia ostertagi]
MEPDLVHVVMYPVISYDIHRNEWADVAPMNARRCGVSVSFLNRGSLYAVGGSDETSVITSLDSREGKWEYVCPMSTQRKYLGTAVIDDCLYAVGGRDGSNCPLSSVEKYDPRNNKWTPLAPMNNARSGVPLASVVSKQLYAVGGFDGIAYLDTVEVFDLEEESVESTTVA